MFIPKSLQGDKKKTSVLDKNDIQSEILEDSFYSRLKFF